MNPAKRSFFPTPPQDAEAARRIAEALRESGVEVWFDRSELRGGDSWDRKIRDQIKECALFMPVISANTQARAEGYFRLEWHLSEERSHLIARGSPFIVPVCVDSTREGDALVPDAFLQVQGMRLADGEATSEACERVRTLLTGKSSGPTAHHPGRERGRESADPGHEAGLRRRPVSKWVLVTVGVAVVVVALLVLRPASVFGPSNGTAASIGDASTPARKLARRAVELATSPNTTRAKLEGAEQLIGQAKEMDPVDADVWAIGASIDAWFVFYEFDTSTDRKERARSGSERALALNPDSFEVRLARAQFLTTIVPTPETLREAEGMLRGLISERSDEIRALEMLANVVRGKGEYREAAGLFVRAGSLNAAGWAYAVNGQFADAHIIAERLVDEDPSIANLTFKLAIETWGLENLQAAHGTLGRLPASALLEDRTAAMAAMLHIYRRDPERTLDIMRALPREWMESAHYTGPKSFLIAAAHELAGRHAAADAEFRAALKMVNERLEEKSNSLLLVRWKALLLASLKETDEASRVLMLEQQLSGREPTEFTQETATAAVLLGDLENVIVWLERILPNPGPDSWWIHALIRFDPAFAPLRGNPRVEALLRETLADGAKPFPDRTAGTFTRSG